MSPNARWQVADNEIYHVIARGNDRRQIFHTDSDFRHYLKLLEKYKVLYPVFLFHYCLMSNHIHLLLKVLQGEHLKKFMQGVSQSYSNYYKRAYKYSGHLWQGRYKSFLIESDSYLLECGRYIERNPVRAKLVRDPNEWPWSSFGYYGSGQANSILDHDPLYDDLGNTEAERRNAYRNYLAEERPYETLVDKQFAAV